MNLKVRCGFLSTNYGENINDSGLKHPGGEIHFIHILKKIESQIDIFPPFQNALSQSILVNIVLLWHAQIKPV